MTARHRAEAFCARFGLRVPILMAPMAGACPPPLAAAIGSAGGMGGFGGHMFDMADGNRDGRVTLQEAQAAALRHFDMADVNRDGQITPDERNKMRQRMRAEHRG